MKNSATATIVKVRQPPMLCMLNFDDVLFLLVVVRRWAPYLDVGCCLTVDA